MDDFGVLAISAYLPKTYLPRSVIAEAHAWCQSSTKKTSGGRRIAGHDEDAITMAVEAARLALYNQELTINQISFSSVTTPFIDRSAAVLIAEALNGFKNVQCINQSGSLRAATSAMAACQKDSISLCLASDNRLAKPGSQAEFDNGDAATAVILGRGEVLARWVASTSYNADFVDHYKDSYAMFDYSLEGRWLRDEGYGKIAVNAIEQLLIETKIDASAIDHLLIAGPQGNAAKFVAKKANLLNANYSAILTKEVGFCGNAQPILLLMEALSQAKPGDKLLLCGFGQGCDVILLEATSHCIKNNNLQKFNSLLSQRTEENSYLKYVISKGLLDMDWGLRAERDNRTAMTAQYRNKEAVTSFNAGCCEQCNTVQFPLTSICVNPECHATNTQKNYVLQDAKAKVKSFTEDWLAFSPMPPLMYGNVQFDCGANVIMEYTDFIPSQLSTELPLQMVYRIKDQDKQRQFRRYCWKASPLKGAS